MPEYFPYEYRRPNSQYADTLYHTLRNGFLAESTRQGVNAITVMQQKMDFWFCDGFPVNVDRDLGAFWNRSIGEICAFINGVTTVEGLVDFGCTWWAPWADESRSTGILGMEPGNIGPASYGGAFHDFPTLDGDTFDQFAHLPEQIKKLPFDRVHFITPWMAKENHRATKGYQRTTIAPCHGWVHVRILGDQLHLHMFQRAGDFPVGVPSNTIQYAALALMLEQLTGYKATALYHTVSDTHIYSDQVDDVLQMFTREPRRYPTVTLTEEGREVTDIHDFRMCHFQLHDDYQPHPAIPGIPVAT